MVEHDNVVNPLGHVKSRDEFSDSMSRKPSGGGPSGAMPLTDDHRDRHELEEDRRYARRVLEAAERFVKEQQPQRLVLSASPGLLGVLRSELDPRRLGSLDLTELPQDVSNQSLSQIRGVLTKRGLLPEPVVPSAGVYRPRGQ
jgi:protein required for attachment to host cells